MACLACNRAAPDKLPTGKKSDSFVLTLFSDSVVLARLCTVIFGAKAQRTFLVSKVQ